MADIDSSLPIKTEGDVHELVQVKNVDYTTPSQGQEIDTDGDAHVKAKLRDDSGAAFGTVANPVSTLPQTTAGDSVEDYQTSASVAKNATVNHDYTVTALKTLTGKSVVVSASGEFKFEVQKETGVSTGVYNTLYVAFAQASRPFVQLDLKDLTSQVAGANIRIAIENRDKAQDLYSTLMGCES